MNRPSTDAAPVRPTCYRCFRPEAFCLCAAIPKVSNRTEVMILQHPRERTHPFGTARLAELGLGKVEVRVDYAGCLRRDSSPLGDLDGAALLYPRSGARDVSELTAQERPRRLVVIDGTWHHARTLYRDIPVLQALPHLTLPGHLRSAYQIRRQPSQHCLSTIEAIVHALFALEPETTGLGALLAAFDTMQAGQLALPRDAGRAHKEKRARASRAIPRRLVEGYESLVVAYAESTLDATGPRGRRLLYCAAARPATGERFRGVVRHPGLSDAHVAHLGLRREELEAGLSPEAFGAEWSSFLGDRDNLAAWNQSTLDLLCDAAGFGRGGVALKAAYHNLRRHHGALEEVVRLEQLGQPAVVTGGRAEARLHNAVQLAEFLHQRARGER